VITSKTAFDSPDIRQAAVVSLIEDSRRSRPYVRRIATELCLQVRSVDRLDRDFVLRLWSARLQHPQKEGVERRDSGYARADKQRKSLVESSSSLSNGHSQERLEDVVPQVRERARWLRGKRLARLQFCVSEEAVARQVSNLCDGATRSGLFVWHDFQSFVCRGQDATFDREAPF
jgi:hypothetical protein